MVRAESSAVLACARSSSSFATRVTNGVIASATSAGLILVGTVKPPRRNWCQTTRVDFARVTASLTALDEPRYRSKQVYEAVTRSFALDYDGITPLPVALRAKLAEAAPLRQL